MKTINANKGNKNNQVTRALLRGAAVVVSVILLSFTVSAQGLWKQLLTYNSFGKVAMLMVDESEAAEVADASESFIEKPATTESFSFEQATDVSLELEGWMTDDLYFGAYNNFYRVDNDQPLEVEEWMTNDNYFSNRFATEKDGELELESWMSDDNYWAL